MVGTHRNEPNLMMRYFGQGSATYDVAGYMRNEFLKGSLGGLERGLVKRAKKEVDKKRMELDGPTYEFAQELYSQVFCGGDINHECRKKAIMVVQGDLLSRVKGIIDTVVPIEIADYTLFKNPEPGETVDETVTRKFTNQFIRDNRPYLRDQSYQAFSIKSSKIFDIREDKLNAFMDENGGLDARALVPFLTETFGYVVTTPIAGIPRKDKYRDLAPTFSSYRQKNSLAEKLLRKLGNGDRLRDKDTIDDWVAHRIVVDSEEEARYWVDFFESNPQLRTFRLRHLHTDDYYTDRKKNSFRNFNLTLSVSSPRFKIPTVREIQIVDKMQYRENEIDPDSPAHHTKAKAKHRTKKEVRDSYEYHMEEIFGKDDMLLPI